MKTKVRFAPSPTGNLHIGGARTAYYNWLFARSRGGEFVLRIEDTDILRSRKEFEENIVADLKWLGIDWDHFYRQSDRVEIYVDYADRLLQENKAYPCFCTDEELELMRVKARKERRPPMYNGRCRNLTPQEREDFRQEGREPVIRFKIPEQEKSMVINDLIKGEVKFDRVMTGDFVILKSDGMPTYNFAAAVDDHLMEITHVLRAEEHLPNTPKQLMLYKSLSVNPPKFGHMSLLLGDDRKKLSKRHGSITVKEFRKKGYLPETLKNYFALLGWSSKDKQEIFSESELFDLFSLDNLMTSPQVFDFDKLDWLNNYYLRQADLDRVTKLAIPWIRKAGYIENDRLSKDEYEKLKKIVDLLRPSISHLSELKEHEDLKTFYDFSSPDTEAEEILNDKTSVKIIKKFSEALGKMSNISSIETTELIQKVKSEMKVDAKHVYKPLRIAITGRTSGPEINQIISILGPTETKKRLKRAIKRIFRIKG